VYVNDVILEELLLQDGRLLLQYVFQWNCCQNCAFCVSLSSDCVTTDRSKIKRNILELQYSVSVAFATEHSLHLDMESDTFLWFLSDRYYELIVY